MDRRTGKGEGMNKEKRREYMREYRQRPEVKEKMREYKQRPETIGRAMEKIMNKLGYSKKTQIAMLTDGIILDNRLKELKKEAKGREDN